MKHTTHVAMGLDVFLEIFLKLCCDKIMPLRLWLEIAICHVSIYILAIKTVLNIWLFMRTKREILLFLLLVLLFCVVWILRARIEYVLLRKRKRLKILIVLCLKDTNTYRERSRSVKRMQIQLKLSFST